MTAEAIETGPRAGTEAPAAADDRPLRIALLTYKGNPFCGGQGVYVRHLGRELARLGHSVEVIGAQPYPVLDEGVPLTELPSLDLYRQPDPFRTPGRGEFRDWIDLAEVATMWTGGFPEPLTFSLRARRHLLARRGDFDVVHDNQTLGYGLLGDLGAPLVTTIHHPITVDRQLDLDAADSRRRRASVRRWYAFTRMQKRVARRLPSVLTVSGSSQQEIVEHLGVRQDRVRVVHIGADTDLWSPDPSVAEVPGRIVTTSSADVPLKGLVHLVEALAKLRTENPGAHLVVVGKRAEDGPVAQAIERHGLQDAVRFVKGISDAELVDLVRSAQIACVPSLYEGFSLPAAEAMATGTPSSRPPAARSPRSPGPTGRPASRCRPATRARWPWRSPGCSTTRNCGPASARPAAPGCWPTSPGPERPSVRPSCTVRRSCPGEPAGDCPRRPRTPYLRPRRQALVLTVDFTRFPLAAGDRVLDLGCGAGRHAFECYRRGAQVVALDQNAEEIREVAKWFAAMKEAGEAPEGATATAMEGDALNLPFPDDSFDVVIISEVMEHIPDDKGVLAEMVRVLRPGGRIAITVPRYGPEKVCWSLSDAYHEVEGGHIRIYKADELLRKIREAGLKPYGTHHAHALHSPYWWLKCAFGVDNDKALPVRAYHKLLVWDIMKKPAVTRVAEQLLNPVVGKSFVAYATKPHLPKAEA